MHGLLSRNLPTASSKPTVFALLLSMILPNTAPRRVNGRASRRVMIFAIVRDALETAANPWLCFQKTALLGRQRH